MKGWQHKAGHCATTRANSMTLYIFVHTSVLQYRTGQVERWVRLFTGRLEAELAYDGCALAASLVYAWSSYASHAYECSSCLKEKQMLKTITLPCTLCSQWSHSVIHWYSEHLLQQNRYLGIRCLCRVGTLLLMSS